MYYLADRYEMQEIDRQTIEEAHVPGILLMERAAIATLEEINRRLKADCGKDRVLRFLVVVGGGNNGGDGLALARLLHQQGDVVDVCYINKLARTTESFDYQLDIVRNMGIPIYEEIPDSEYDVVVDGIFGVGLKREVTGIWKSTICTMNELGGYKVAIDMPSGVDVTTGQVLGTCFKADLTVTFGLNKLGLILYPGKLMAGAVAVCDIGFAKKEIERVRPKAYTYDRSDLMRLPERIDASNKGTYGRVAVIAGSEDMAGAAVFAADAAYRLGAGLVKVYTHRANRDIIGARVPEAILKTYSDRKEAEACAADALSFADVILIGPGIGLSDASIDMVRYIMKQAGVPVIADADALNIMAKQTGILKEHSSELVVTPHVGEMSRLTGLSISDIKKNEVGVCKDFSREYNVVGVLKDARTVVCHGDASDDTVYVNTSGNNGMSTAGSGDVLSGIIAGLVATGLQANEAARLGVYIHGLAGDEAARHTGKTAMKAGDIVRAIPRVIKGAER